MNLSLKQKRLEKALKREMVLLYQKDPEKLNKQQIIDWSKQHNVTRESIQRFMYKIKDIDKKGRFESYFFQKDKQGNLYRI